MSFGTAGAARRTSAARQAWRRTEPRDRAVLVGGAVLVTVLALLAVIEPAALPLAAIALVVQAALLARCLCSPARAQRRQDDVVQEEAARGIGELEAWLTTHRHA